VQGLCTGLACAAALAWHPAQTASRHVAPLPACLAACQVPGASQGQTAGSARCGRPPAQLGLCALAGLALVASASAPALAAAPAALAARERPTAAAGFLSIAAARLRVTLTYPGHLLDAVLRRARAGRVPGGRGDRLWRPHVLRSARPPPLSLAARPEWSAAEEVRRAIGLHGACRALRALPRAQPLPLVPDCYDAPLFPRQRTWLTRRVTAGVVVSLWSSIATTGETRARSASSSGSIAAHRGSSTMYRCRAWSGWSGAFPPAIDSSSARALTHLEVRCSGSSPWTGGPTSTALPGASEHARC